MEQQLDEFNKLQTELPEQAKIIVRLLSILTYAFVCYISLFSVLFSVAFSKRN